MKKIVGIVAICIVLITAISVFLLRHPHELPEPKYDLSSLQEVVIKSQDDTEDSVYCIKDNSYIAYCTLDKDELSCGDAIAYFINDDHFCYFLKIEGLSENDWLVLFNDWPNQDAEYTLLKNIDTTQIPKQIEVVALKK